MVGGRPNLMYSPGPGLWSLVLGPFGPDLGTDLNLTWDLDLDLSLTIFKLYALLNQENVCPNPNISCEFNFFFSSIIGHGTETAETLKLCLGLRLAKRII